MSFDHVAVVYWPEIYWVCEGWWNSHSYQRVIIICIWGMSRLKFNNIKKTKYEKSDLKIPLLLHLCNRKLTVPMKGTSVSAQTGKGTQIS